MSQKIKRELKEILQDLVDLKEKYRALDVMYERNTEYVKSRTNLAREIAGLPPLEDESA